MARGPDQVISVFFSAAAKSRAAFSASPVSMDAPTEPDAPKARRANLSRTEAFSALVRMRSIASASAPPSSSSGRSASIHIALRSTSR